MGRAGLLAVLMLAACTHRPELNLLEREKARFRVENETIRVEDLEGRYEEQKRKADALSAELLALQRERDRLYQAYDVARGEIVRLERELKACGERSGGLAHAVAEAKAEVHRLEEDLDKERRAIEALEAQLAAARARRAELESPGTGTSG